MRQRNRARSSSLFLLELIIAILFFSVASAVCVQFFVKSHTMSEQSQQLNTAVNECSSIAEIVQTSDSRKDVISTVKNIYGTAAVCDENTIQIALEDGMKIEADLSESDGMISCAIDAFASDNDKAVYELEVKHNAKK